MKMAKDVENFNDLIKDMDKDLEYLAEENLNLAKIYFNSINSLLNINPQIFYKQIFRELKEIDNPDLINNNCSNTLFVFGWLYERLADGLESKIDTEKELFLVSACKALSKYKLANSNRQKVLFEKYDEQKQIKIINKADFLGYDIDFE